MSQFGECEYAEAEWACCKRAGHTGPHESASVRTDVRDALRSEHDAEWHRWRLDRIVRSYWRIAIFIAVVMVLGSIAELLQ
jgi:hypothetical protein